MVDGGLVVLCPLSFVDTVLLLVVVVDVSFSLLSSSFFLLPSPWYGGFLQIDNVWPVAFLSFSPTKRI